MTSNSWCFVCQNSSEGFQSLLSPKLSLKFLCKLFNLPSLVGSLLKSNQISGLNVCRKCEEWIQDAKKSEEEIKSLNLKIQLSKDQLWRVINAGHRKRANEFEAPLAVAVVRKYFYQCLNNCEVRLNRLNEVDLSVDVPQSQTDGGIAKERDAKSNFKTDLEGLSGDVKAETDSDSTECKTDVEELAANVQPATEHNATECKIDLEELPADVKEENVSSDFQEEDLVIVPFYVERSTVSCPVGSDQDKDSQTSLAQVVMQKSGRKQRLFVREDVSLEKNKDTTGERKLIDSENRASRSDQIALRAQRSLRKAKAPKPSSQVAQKRKKLNAVGHASHQSENPSNTLTISIAESQLAEATAVVTPARSRKRLNDAFNCGQDKESQSISLDCNTQPMQEPRPQHITAERQTRKKTANCRHCSLDFTACRQPTNSNSPGDPKYFYICSLQDCCGGHRIFKTHRQFTKHHWKKCPQNPFQLQAKIVQSMRKYSCEKCDKVYVSIVALRNHVLSVHDKKYEFCCEKCGAGFVQHASLEQHMVKHSSEQPFKCDQCEKAFKWRKTLTYHKRSHTREQPYVCEICGKAFSWIDNFHKHLENVHGEAKHPCGICGKLFRSKLYVYFHNKNVHKEGNVTTEGEEIGGQEIMEQESSGDQEQAARNLSASPVLV